MPEIIEIIARTYFLINVDFAKELLFDLPLKSLLRRLPLFNLPPGNSQYPASVFPCPRCAHSTLPSLTIAAPTTRISLGSSGPAVILPLRAGNSWIQDTTHILVDTLRCTDARLLPYDVGHGIIRTRARSKSAR